MQPPPETEARLAATTTAWHPRDAHGRILGHPAWHDVTPHERELAFEATAFLPMLEATLDSQGLNSTSRAVLGRIP